MEYDAVVIGSGPNGLAAAITLQQQGVSVLLLEGNKEIGGGLRTADLTLPGFKHDICSAIHPMGVASPFFQSLPLVDYGLEWINPTRCAAHPLDDGTTVILDQSLDTTAARLGIDELAYRKLVSPVTKDFTMLLKNILGPLKFPTRGTGNFLRFGFRAMQSAKSIASRFSTEEAKALWAGMAAHSLQPLENIASAGVGMVLSTSAHVSGWPMAKGGSQSIANALLSCFRAMGGKIETNFYVRSLSQLPSAKVYLFDVTPRQLLEIAGHKFSAVYEWQLKRYRYGMAAFKIDWALDDVVPFRSEECRHAGTVHIGNTYNEIALSERLAWNGKHSEKPFVLFAQQSVFDKTRAPEGKHTAWAYCHVPNGSNEDMTERIERQIERFAPAFRERILARHTFDSRQLEAYNPNYVGGDINAGAIDISQLFTRPALRLSPYRTSARGVYICSASTPPGGGVHGMCGYHAANRALRDEFGTSAKVML